MHKDVSEQNAPFRVDLDRDLLAGNLSAERFWGGMGDTWRALFNGHRRVEPQNLPLDPGVVAACEAARASGREVILYNSGDTDLSKTLAKRIGAARIEPGTAPDDGPTRAGHGSSARAVWRQIRPHQWVKNVLIFLPLLAAHAFGLETLASALLAFVAFSLIASAVYVLNDLSDLAADRRHPTKCNRPFASGALSVRKGGVMLVALLLAGFLVAAFVNLTLVLVLAAYLVLTTAYSMNLKGRLALDIVVLALLYTVRIGAGAAATGIVPSVWLLSFSIFLFLSLASTKRLSELVGLDSRPGTTAAAGRAYTVEDLPIIAMIATSAGFIAVLVLALYLDSPEVRALYDNPMLLWGICLLLLFWVSRIVLLAHRGLVHEDPVVFALRDTVSRLVAVTSAGLFISAALI